MDVDKYRAIFETYLKERKWIKEPKGLYEPIDYVLSLGGKRIRAILALIAADLYSGETKNALDVAVAIEIFHNFTLVHDDIIDRAPLRRGKETIHVKWGLNTGILSGDAMLISAYKFLESYKPRLYKQLMLVFNQTALRVCQGQQLDIDFQTISDVSIKEYISMITLKTSVLLASALKMGALTVGVSEKETQKVYTFGLYLGIAFQIQDDYLDAYADPDTFGKQVAGDIIENKKTFLYILAIREATVLEKKNLITLFTQKTTPDNKLKKIERVLKIFTALKVPDLTKKMIKSYTEKAFNFIDEMKIENHKKNSLKQLSCELMNRKV